MITNLNFTYYQPIPQKKHSDFNRNIAFKGHFGRELSDKNALGALHIETGFFRDFPTMKFIKNYIKKEFKDRDTINIMIAGCSTGEQALSYSMLLNDLDKKMNILAFDISHQNIEAARNGIYRMEVRENKHFDIMEGVSDCYLWENSKKHLSKDQKNNRLIFEENFEMLNPKSQVKENDKNESIYSYPDINLEHSYCKLKPNKINNVQFTEGNIIDIDKIAKGEKQDIIVMTYALYHLATQVNPILNVREISPSGKSRVDEVVKKVKNILNEKGAFVIGEFEYRTLGINKNSDKKSYLPNIIQENGFKILNVTKKHFPNVFGVNSGSNSSGILNFINTFRNSLKKLN